jgi:hypothetical protein
MNSFRISFYIVPDNLLTGWPYSIPAEINMAKIGNTAPFIVIETEILSKGI